MGTKYVTEAISGYNSSPPADDGSTAASNQVKWSTIKSKLPDPLKTAIENINSKLVTALDFSARSVTSADSTVAGDHMRTLEVPSTVTATFTISLGDAATMANGYIVRIRNSSAIPITIGRVTSGDTIDGVTGNILLGPKSTAIFAVNPSANGYETLGQTPGLVLLSSKTASASASIDFTSVITSTFSEYIVLLDSVIPATAGADFYMRTSTDNATFTTSASYDHIRRQNTTTDTAPSGLGASGDTKIILANALATTASRGAKASVTLSTSLNQIDWSIGWRVNTTNALGGANGNAQVVTSSVNAVQFLMSAGNIASGTFSMYGVRK